jgi:cyclophilin family peptidyl-prolyl cis-trans isomerase
MKNIAIILLSFLFLIVACKKDDSDDSGIKTTTTTTSAATPQDTTEELIELKTNFGTMYMWLYKETPQHRSNFLNLAKEQYFDSTTFHRCVKNFVIQGGDPNSKDADTTNDGSGGPGYTIPAEIDTSLFKHKRGAVGAARTNNPAKASSGSQFYIVLPKGGTPTLDNNYTVFGEIIGGMEVADTIVLQPQNAKNRPYTDIRMDINIIKRTRKQLRDQFNFYL